MLFGTIGFACGLLKGNISLDNKMSLALMTGIGTIVLEIGYLLLMCILRQINLDYLYILKVLILESLYNIILAAMFFGPLTIWLDIMNRSRREYYEL